jgi:hypothetical protein
VVTELNKYLGIVIILLSVIGIETGYIAYTEFVRIREMRDTLAAYRLAMGYIGFTTNKTGKAIQIQSMALTGTTFHAYVQNVGDSQISLVSASCLYINGTMYPATPTLTILNQGDTSDIQLTSSPVHAGDLVTVKVASVDGTFSQVTQTLP